MSQAVALLLIFTAANVHAQPSTKPADRIPRVSADNAIFDYDWNFEPGKPIEVLPGYFTFLPWRSAQFPDGPRADHRKATGIDRIMSDTPLSFSVTADKRREFKIVIIADGDWKISSSVDSAVIKNPYRGQNRFTSEQTITLLPGKNRVEVVPIDPGKRGAWFFGVELVDVNDWDTIQRMIRETRADTSWWSEQTYGIFFQWGPWGCARDGTQKPYPKMLEDFDVERFADMMEEMGAGWVRWSLTWANQQYPGPLESRDRIKPGYTCEYDFIGRLAEALAKRDIRLCFYWHPGHSDGEFWKAYTGTDDVHKPDRNVWFRNYVRMVSEISNRYGNKVWGFGCDGGRQYYPAPFYHFNLAIKQGNPHAVSQWNSWTLPRLHDFQEHYIGEHVSKPKWPVDDHGIFTTGPQRGLLLGGGFLPERSGWGLRKGKTTGINPPTMSPDAWVNYLSVIKRNRGAVDPCINMWEGGQICRQTYEMFVHARRAFRGISDEQLIAIRKRRGENNPTARSYVWPDDGVRVKARP